LADENMDEYKTYVTQCIQDEEQSAMMFIKEVTEAIGITEQEFGMTHQLMS